MYRACIPLQLSLLLLLFISPQCIAQPHPVIRLGRTFSETGFSSSEARPITNGINFWYEWLKNNSNGGIWNNGVFYEVELIQFDDASSEANIKFMYQAMHELYNLTAAFGPWTQLLTGSILPMLKEMNLPIVVTGAAGGQLYTGANTHMVGMLVNGAKRFLPCFQLFKDNLAKSAIVQWNSDAFMTFAGGVYQAQLASLNISVLATFNFSKGEDDFTEIVEAIRDLKPDFVACAQQENDFRFFLQQLRERIPKKDQPKAIMSANTTPVQVTYNTIGWAGDSVFGGDQWSPTFPFVDERFNSSANFARIYTEWLRSKGFVDEINFWDAASVAGGFVMQAALENTPSFEPSDMIATLRATNFTETFFGPISFTSTGEIASDGICQQLLPFPDPTASLESTDARGLQAVYPYHLASAEAHYPGLYIRPPSPGLSNRRKYLIGFLVGGLGLLAIIIIAVIAILRLKYHMVFIAKEDAKDEWATSP